MHELLTLLSKQSEESARIFSWQGVSISVLYNPRSVLTVKEDEEIVGGLIEDLSVVTNESFGSELENQTKDGVYDHVVNADQLALLHDKNELLGFASSKFFREDEVFYLHGVAVAKHFKGKGAGTALVRVLLSESWQSKIAFTTQNPLMFCLLRNLCSKVYPCPEHSEVPSVMHRLGDKLLTGRAGKFNPSSFVVSELYGRCLYSAIPVCKDDAVNRWFEESLKIEGGLTRDGFLFIGDRKV